MSSWRLYGSFKVESREITIFKIPSNCVLELWNSCHIESDRYNRSPLIDEVVLYLYYIISRVALMGRGKKSSKKERRKERKMEKRRRGEKRKIYISLRYKKKKKKVDRSINLVRIAIGRRYRWLLSFAWDTCDKSTSELTQVYIRS